MEQFKEIKIVELKDALYGITLVGVNEYFVRINPEVQSEPITKEN
jgi:hypothetical protein